MRQDLEERYFQWLCAKVLDHSNVAYERLLKMLHREEFMWVVPMDENRAEDGKDLRQDFFREAFIERDPDWCHQPCSMLEMLIALAKRAEFQTDDPVKWWFWKFIDNMGFLDPWIDEQEFGDHMHIINWRLYGADGTGGGMFPLAEDFGDQRKTELWYQLCHFIEENQLIR